MKRPNRRALTKAIVTVLIAVSVLGSIYSIGHYTLFGMLLRDAMLTADLWRRTASAESAEAIARNLARSNLHEIAESAGVGAVDGVVLIDADGDTRAASSDPDEVAHFLRVVAETGAQVEDLESGAYSADSVRWIGPQHFRSWVIFPPDSSGVRLAVRIRQSAAAAELVTSFSREVLFSGGVAAITFASFMAGFSYRQRQLAAENAAIRYQAMHDGLTGLPNRKHFEEVLAKAMENLDPSGPKVALFILDLDGFKAVNDTLGHPVGDGLLQAASKRLKSSLRAGDVLARLSGDEFAIIVPAVRDPATLGLMAERLVKLVSSPFRVEGHEVRVGCSIGLSVAPDNGADGATLVRNADFALYRAKSEGRETWRFFDPKMAADQESRRTLENGLRHALENDQFQVFYQPQIELATSRITGYEAMVRWRLPGKALVPASVFMTVAEETGLIIPIGEWVIRQVARDCALLPSDRTVAINLSAAQLKRDGIDTFIFQTLASQRILPSRIEVEVNESILGRHEAETFQRLEKIRALGVDVVMDSFGAATISLELLSRYSFDKIKIDRTFLMNDEHKRGAVLAAVCALGRSLGFRVSGQGVETAEHVELLRAAGCSEAQGYYFARPLPLEQVLRLDSADEAPALAAIA